MLHHKRDSSRLKPRLEGRQAENNKHVRKAPST